MYKTILMFVSFLLLLCLNSVRAQGQVKAEVNKVPLDIYLTKIGTVHHWHFTVEEGFRPNNRRIGLLWTPINYTDVASRYQLVTYLLRSVPDIVVRILPDGVISVIDASLVDDANYALNKNVDCKFNGMLYKIPNYLGAKVNNGLTLSRRHDQFNFHSDFATIAECSSTGAIRNILAGCIPLAGYSSILWDAVTDVEGGKEITDIQFWGPKSGSNNTTKNTHSREQNIRT